MKDLYNSADVMFPPSKVSSSMEDRDRQLSLPRVTKAMKEYQSVKERTAELQSLL